MRTVTLMICMCLVICTIGWPIDTQTPEQAWRQLTWALSEIEGGLSMTDLPLSEIENSFAQRSASLDATELRLSKTERRLALYELELTERDAGLQRRGELYDSIDREIAAIKEETQKGIEAGQRTLRIWRWAAAIGSAGTGISTAVAALQADKPITAGVSVGLGALFAAIAAPRGVDGTS